jgi:activator of 2-hydroxyglutaryl-CoA dehydratase
MAKQRNPKMLRMGLDIGSRNTRRAIMEDGQLPTCGNIETGPERGKTAYGAVRCSAWT